MPIAAGDYVWRMSGGAANAVGNLSLGGAKSSSIALPTAVDLLFDQVSAAQNVAGSVEYRCVYLHNANATSTMLNGVVWISANTPLAGSTLAIGIGSAAVNGTEQTVANEGAGPSGVTFSEPATQGAALPIGASIPPGQHKAVWLRRTITAGSGATPSDTFELSAYSEFTS